MATGACRLCAQRLAGWEKGQSFFGGFDIVEPSFFAWNLLQLAMLVGSATPLDSIEADPRPSQLASRQRDPFSLVLLGCQCLEARLTGWIPPFRPP